MQVKPDIVKRYIGIISKGMGVGRFDHCASLQEESNFWNPWISQAFLIWIEWNKIKKTLEKDIFWSYLDNKSYHAAKLPNNRRWVMSSHAIFRFFSMLRFWKDIVPWCRFLSTNFARSAWTWNSWVVTLHLPSVYLKSPFVRSRSRSIFHNYLAVNEIISTQISHWANWL